MALTKKEAAKKREDLLKRLDLLKQVQAKKMDQMRAAGETTQITPEPAEYNPMSPLQFAGRQAESLLRGVTFGALDELQGLAGGVVDYAMGRDFKKGYEKATEQSRERAEEFRDIAPVAAYGSEIAGSLLPSIALAPLAGGKRLAQAALAGAEGATAGALSAEGDLQDRATGAAIGGLLGGATGGVAAALPKASAQAKELEKLGVKLTPGQRGGGATEFTEGLIGKTTVGDLMGIRDATRESFDSFSKAFVENSLSNVGYKAPKGMTVREVIDDADDFVVDTFKKATKKAKLDAEGVSDLETSILTRSYDTEYLSDLGMDKETTGRFLSIVDQFVADKMKKGSLTGQEIADSLSDLTTMSKGLMTPQSTSADRKIGLALYDIGEDIVEAMPKEKATRDLVEARKAYKAMIAVRKAGSGKAKDGFSPVQAQSALEKVYKKGASKAPQARLAQMAKEVLGEGNAPSVDRGRLGANLGTLQLLGLAGGATIAPAAVLPGLALGTAAYRGGRLGSKAASGILATPRLLAEPVSRTPALSGLLAERMTEE